MKITNQIIVLVGLIVLGTLGYFGVREYSDYAIKKLALQQTNTSENLSDTLTPSNTTSSPVDKKITESAKDNTTSTPTTDSSFCVAYDDFHQKGLEIMSQSLVLISPFRDPTNLFQSPDDYLSAYPRLLSNQDSYFVQVATFIKSVDNLPSLSFADVGPLKQKLYDGARNYQHAYNDLLVANNPINHNKDESIMAMMGNESKIGGDSLVAGLTMLKTVTTTYKAQCNL